MTAFAYLYPDALMPASGPFCLDRDEWTALRLGMATIARRAAEIAQIGPVIAGVARDAERLAVAWQHDLYPLSVQLAQQLHAFASATAVRYVKLDSELLHPAGDRQRARQCIRAVHDQSRDCLAVANQLAAMIAAFVVKARDLDRRLQALAAGYERAAATDSENVRQLRAAIDRAQRAVDVHQARYNACVAAAAPSVTYAWIPIIGWVAGGASDWQSAEERRLLDAATAELANLRAQLSREFDEAYRLSRASVGSRDLAAAFDALLPVIRQIAGVWDALAADLGDLDAALDGARESAAPQALRAASRGWAALASAAAAYCAHDGPAIVNPRFFGQYVARLGRTDVSHELVISERGVSVAGVAVLNPIFSTSGLRFTDQADARRDAKPVEAAITFTADGFQGVCRFPGEGPIDWHGHKAA